MRVMTWNIHGAQGRNRRFDLGKVVAFIQRHRPDVVALQEVDSRHRRLDGSPDAFEVLQSALGRHGVGAKTITTTDGEYGQMVISRWPLRDVLVQDISYREREPRRAVRCTVVSPDGPVGIIATHLGLSVGERRGQAQSLNALLDESPPTTVVLGDFNDWFWVGSVRKALAAKLPARSRDRTFPARWPIFRFDRVYCRPHTALLRSWTDPAARDLSDHLPVLADIAIAPAGSLALVADQRLGLGEPAGMFGQQRPECLQTMQRADDEADAPGRIVAEPRQ